MLYALERLAGVGCTVALMERETSISKQADRRKYAESRSCCAEMTSEKEQESASCSVSECARNREKCSDWRRIARCLLVSARWGVSHCP